MQHRLQKKVNAALGHNIPNWAIKYSCPACGFEVRMLCHIIYFNTLNLFTATK
jgi:hypothetical protein